MKSWGQLKIFGILLGVNALLAVATYLLFPMDQIAPASSGAPSPATSMPAWQLGLANGAIVLVIYGLLGLAGFWFAGKLGLPGIYRKWAGWGAWVVRPGLLGLGVGVVLVLVDRFFTLFGGWQGFAHPPFPLSIIASATAGIGEEILFRMFVLGLWAFLANLFLWRWIGLRGALWIGNLAGALAFGAAHLPAAMVLLNVSSPSELPATVLAELFLLNGFMGLVAGDRYIRDGLVAAVGVHFWADVVWHVLWPLVGSA